MRRQLLIPQEKVLAIIKFKPLTFVLSPSSSFSLHAIIAIVATVVATTTDASPLFDVVVANENAIEVIDDTVEAVDATIVEVRRSSSPAAGCAAIAASHCSGHPPLLQSSPPFVVRITESVSFVESNHVIEEFTIILVGEDRRAVVIDGRCSSSSGATHLVGSFAVEADEVATSCSFIDLTTTRLDDIACSIVGAHESSLRAYAVRSSSNLIPVGTSIDEKIETFMILLTM